MRRENHPVRRLNESTPLVIGGIGVVITAIVSPSPSCRRGTRRSPVRTTVAPYPTRVGDPGRLDAVPTAEAPAPAGANRVRMTLSTAPKAGFMPASRSITADGRVPGPSPRRPAYANFKLRQRTLARLQEQSSASSTTPRDGSSSSARIRSHSSAGGQPKAAGSEHHIPRPGELPAGSVAREPSSGVLAMGRPVSSGNGVSPPRRCVRARDVRVGPLGCHLAARWSPPPRGGDRPHLRAHTASVRAPRAGPPPPAGGAPASRS